MDGDQRIRDRKFGRELAADCLGLAREQFPGASREMQQAFWEAVVVQAESALTALGVKKLEPIKPSPAANEPAPMDEHEAIHFQRMLMPSVFKKYAGKTVRQLMGSDPGYLDWVSRGNEIDEFKADLRRYMDYQELERIAPHGDNEED